MGPVRFKSYTQRGGRILLITEPEPEDLHSSSAELVYGEPLMIPGELVPRNTTPWTTSNLVRQSHIPIPTTTHKIPRSSVPTSFMSSRFVFIRHDAHITPLQCPYDGPYEVLEPGDKVFHIRLGDREEKDASERSKLRRTKP